MALGILSAKGGALGLTLAVSAAFRRSQYFDSPGRRTPDALSQIQSTTAGQAYQVVKERDL